MPTTRTELQSIPKEWFQQNLDQIVSDIVRQVVYLARTATYYEHDVLQRTKGSGVYSQTPRIVLEDVLEGLKKEFADSKVEIVREHSTSGTIVKLVIRIDWSTDTKE
jgi:hypothetical protein